MAFAYCLLPIAHCLLAFAQIHGKTILMNGRFKVSLSLL